jgi:hypothetical protein
MIIDYQGRVPRYIIDGDRLVHQGTGCYVMLYERSDAYMRAAMARLKSLLYASGYSAGEILCSTYVGSYPIK